MGLLQKHVLFDAEAAPAFSFCDENGSARLVFGEAFVRSEEGRDIPLDGVYKIVLLGLVDHDDFALKGGLGGELAIKLVFLKTETISSIIVARTHATATFSWPS